MGDPVPVKDVLPGVLPPGLKIPPPADGRAGPLLRRSAAAANVQAAQPPPRELPVIISAAELAQHPELLRPPECVLPRLAYRGCVVLLSGPPKSGKSTLAADGAAMLTLGKPWLGEPTRRPGHVLWAGLEEPLGHAFGRFVDMGADLGRLDMVGNPVQDLLAWIKRALDETPADLLVIDSLMKYARVIGEVPKDGDSAGWNAVIDPLVDLARDYNTAPLILHHARRQGGYRGSTEIEARVDALLELSVPNDDKKQPLRRLEGSGRWPVEDCTLTLDPDNHYQLAGGALTLDMRVLLDIEANPGTSRNGVRARIQARKADVLVCVARHIASGAVRDSGRGLWRTGAEPAVEGL